jgi:hypothetical protein
MTEEERATKLATLAHLKGLGEKAYDDMYEARSFGSASVCYSDAKEFLRDAIGLAEELGLADEAATLEKRLEHIKAVFRNQFVQ